jgi:hypothetical protein
MITISAFKDREEALISKALLEAAGVTVTLRDEDGELQLQVRDTDAQLAQEVLNSSEAEERRSRALVRISAGRGFRVARQFFKGGGLVVVGFLLLLLIGLPLGVGLRVNPFALFFLFVFGGCVSVILGSFKVREKRRFRRREP